MPSYKSDSNMKLSSAISLATAAAKGDPLKYYVVRELRRFVSYRAL